MSCGSIILQGYVNDAFIYLCSSLYSSIIETKGALIYFGHLIVNCMFPTVQLVWSQQSVLDLFVTPFYLRLSIFNWNFNFLYILKVLCIDPPFTVCYYQFAVKRKAVGIWGCKDCGKVKAGGAYTMKYVLIICFLFFPNYSLVCPSCVADLAICVCSTASAVTVRSTIRRLREQTEA